MTRPRRYGWTWSALLSTGYPNNAPSADQVAAIRGDADLSGVTAGILGTVYLEGQTVSAYGFDAMRGFALPAANRGRWPRGPDEIAIGAQTLRDLHHSIGDLITATLPDGTTTQLRIVGQTLLPSIDINTTLGANEGAALASSALRHLDNAIADGQIDFFLVDFKSNTTLTPVSRRYSAMATTHGPTRPGDIRSYAHVSATPLLLAGLLALLGAGVLADALVVSVRTHRRDLAILKIVGFTPRQVRTTVAWQATALVSAALAVGVPLGVVFGTWTWRSFADNLGIDPATVTPILAFVGIVVVSIALGNGIAALPARRAASTRPAVAFNSE